jgi:hypothetical protein
MAIKRSVEYGSLVLFLAFIGLILVIFYNYLTTPNFKPFPFLCVVMWLMVASFLDFGEFLGRYLKKKNMITEGGLSAVYHSHVNHSNGMSTYYCTTQKRYLDFVGYEDYEEKNVLMRFFTRFTNSRMFSITDHSHKFEEVADYASDTPEGAIIFRGCLRKGVKIMSPTEMLRIRLNQAYGIISEFATIAEKAKAVSEQSAQSQSKDIVESVIKVGTALQNLPIQQQQKYPPMNQGGMYN